MLQAPMFECLALDPFSSFDDGWCPAEVGIGRRYVVEALVVALVIVVLDERLDLVLKIAWQEVVLQQHTVLEGLVPALDLALGLRMEGCAANVIHLLAIEIVGQFSGDVTRAVVAQESRPVQHIGVVAA